MATLFAADRPASTSAGKLSREASSTASGNCIALSTRCAVASKRPSGVDATTSARDVVRTSGGVRHPGTIPADEGSSINESALDFPALRASGARRFDFRSRQSHGLPAGRIVPAGATGARLECQPGGAAHACVGQPPPTRRSCGGRPTSSDVRADRDAPTRDGWAGSPFDGVARPRPRVTPERPTRA